MWLTKNLGAGSCAIEIQTESVNYELSGFLFDEKDTLIRQKS